MDKIHSVVIEKKKNYLTKNQVFMLFLAQIKKKHGKLLMKFVQLNQRNY